MAHAGRENVSPHLDKLLPSLRENGWRPHVLGWDRERAYPKEESRDGITYETIIKGGGFASRRLAIWLPLWGILSLIALIIRKPRLLMAIDFEAGLPSAIASRLTRLPFIYNVRDNFSLRRNWPAPLSRVIDRIDLWIMRGSAAVIFPDECRVPSRLHHNRVLIVRNCAPDIAQAMKSTSPPRKSGLILYAMGYLRSSRGINLLMETVSTLDDVWILAAGTCPEPLLRTALSNHEKVDFRGPVPMEEALELCNSADIVFTFYDPSTRINQLAVSNKWSDAMMMNRPILVNSEVIKSSWLVEKGVALSCNYNAPDLRRTLVRAREDKGLLQEMGKTGRLLYDGGYRWDVMEKRIISLLEQLDESVGNSEAS